MNIRIFMIAWNLLLLALLRYVSSNGLCEQQMQSGFQLLKLGSTTSKDSCFQRCCNAIDCQLSIVGKTTCFGIICPHKSLCTAISEQLSDFQGHRVDKRSLDSEQDFIPPNITSAKEELIYKRSSDNDDDDDDDDDDNDDDDDDIEEGGHDKKTCQPSHYKHSKIPKRKKGYKYRQLSGKIKSLTECSKKCCKIDDCVLAFTVSTNCFAVICADDKNSCHSKEDKLPFMSVFFSLVSLKPKKKPHKVVKKPKKKVSQKNQKKTFHLPDTNSDGGRPMDNFDDWQNLPVHEDFPSKQNYFHEDNGETDREKYINKVRTNIDDEFQDDIRMLNQAKSNANKMPIDDERMSHYNQAQETIQDPYFPRVQYHGRDDFDNRFDIEGYSHRNDDSVNQWREVKLQDYLSHFNGTSPTSSILRYPPRDFTQSTDNINKHISTKTSQSSFPPYEKPTEEQLILRKIAKLEEKLERKLTTNTTNRPSEHAVEKNTNYGKMDSGKGTNMTKINKSHSGHNKKTKEKSKKMEHVRPKLEGFEFRHKLGHEEYFSESLSGSGSGDSSSPETKTEKKKSLVKKVSKKHKNCSGGKCEKKKTSKTSAKPNKKKSSKYRKQKHLLSKPNVHVLHDDIIDEKGELSGDSSGDHHNLMILEKIKFKPSESVTNTTNSKENITMVVDLSPTVFKNYTTANASKRQKIPNSHKTRKKKSKKSKKSHKLKKKSQKDRILQEFENFRRLYEEKKHKVKNRHKLIAQLEAQILESGDGSGEGIDKKLTKHKSKKSSKHIANTTPPPISTPSRQVAKSTPKPPTTTLKNTLSTTVKYTQPSTTTKTTRTTTTAKPQTSTANPFLTTKPIHGTTTKAKSNKKHTTLSKTETEKHQQKGVLPMEKTTQKSPKKKVNKTSHLPLKSEQSEHPDHENRPWKEMPTEKTPLKVPTLNIEVSDEADTTVGPVTHKKVDSQAKKKMTNSQHTTLAPHIKKPKLNLKGSTQKHVPVLPNDLKMKANTTAKKKPNAKVVKNPHTVPPIPAKERLPPTKDSLKDQDKLSPTTQTTLKPHRTDTHRPHMTIPFHIPTKRPQTTNPVLRQSNKLKNILGDLQNPSNVNSTKAEDEMPDRVGSFVLDSVNTHHPTQPLATVKKPVLLNNIQKKNFIQNNLLNQTKNHFPEKINTIHHNDVLDKIKMADVLQNKISGNGFLRDHPMKSGLAGSNQPKHPEQTPRKQFVGPKSLQQPPKNLVMKPENLGPFKSYFNKQKSAQIPQPLKQKPAQIPQPLKQKSAQIPQPPKQKSQIPQPLKQKPAQIPQPPKLKPAQISQPPKQKPQISQPPKQKPQISQPPNPHEIKTNIQPLGRQKLLPMNRPVQLNPKQIQTTRPPLNAPKEEVISTKQPNLSPSHKVSSEVAKHSKPIKTKSANPNIKEKTDKNPEADKNKTKPLKKENSFDHTKPQITTPTKPQLLNKPKKVEKFNIKAELKKTFESLREPSTLKTILKKPDVILTTTNAPTKRKTTTNAQNSGKGKPIAVLNDFFNKHETMKPANLGTNHTDETIHKKPTNSFKLKTQTSKTMDGLPTNCNILKDVRNMVLTNVKETSIEKVPDITNAHACVENCCKHQMCAVSLFTKGVCKRVQCDGRSCHSLSPANEDVHLVFIQRNTTQFCVKQSYVGVPWEETMAGSAAVRECPRDAIGKALRKCDARAHWGTPDFSGCISTEYSSLHRKMKGLGYTSSARSLVRELDDVTTQSIDNSLIFGGDLLKTTEIMDGISQFLTNTGVESFDHTDLRSFTRSLSNLLDETNKQEWNNLQDDIIGPTKLMQSLDNIGLYSAKKLPYASEMKPVITRSVLLSVGKRSPNQLQKYMFPNYTTPGVKGWTNRRDLLTIPHQTFSAGQNTLVASVAFKTLGFLLPHRWNKKRHVTFTDGFTINSNVISTSLTPKPVGTINPPVVIVFQNLKEIPASESKCVYWDFGSRDNGGSWSTEGCTLLSSNRSTSVCACNHLTHFAVLAHTADQKVSAKELGKEHRMAFVWISIPFSLVMLLGALYSCFAWTKAPRRRHVVIMDKKPVLPKEEAVVTQTVSERYPGSPNRYLYAANVTPSPSELEWEHGWELMDVVERKHVQKNPSSEGTSLFHWKYQDDFEWSKDRIKCVARLEHNPSSSDYESMMSSSMEQNTKGFIEKFSPVAVSSPRSYEELLQKKAGRLLATTNYLKISFDHDDNIPVVRPACKKHLTMLKIDYSVIDVFVDAKLSCAVRGKEIIASFNPQTSRVIEDLFARKEHASLQLTSNTANDVTSPTSRLKTKTHVQNASIQKKIFDPFASNVRRLQKEILVKERKQTLVRSQTFHMKSYIALRQQCRANEVTKVKKVESIRRYVSHPKALKRLTDMRKEIKIMRSSVTVPRDPLPTNHHKRLSSVTKRPRVPVKTSPNLYTHHSSLKTTPKGRTNENKEDSHEKRVFGGHLSKWHRQPLS